jgi:probable rRNA maturation factor
MSDTEREPVSIEIEISDTQGHLRTDHPSLSGLARRALQAEGIERASISLALVDNATIHEVNRRHLGHDWPTDVISFRLSEPGDPVLTGEIIISAEMAAETARRAGVDPAAELALYLVHGLLHLCGYDDQSAEDIEAIRRREREILYAEGLTNTYLLPDLSRAGETVRESARWSV